MKTLKNIQNLKNKKVLVRVDFNVPVGDDGIIDGKEDWRIRAALPTIKYLLEKKAKIVLMSHLGRPRKHQISASNVAVDFRLRGNDKTIGYSLKPAASRLEELLNRKIKFVDDCIGEKVKKAVEEMRAGGIILLENLRFYKEEKNNDEGFARKLADLADIYINNAFSVSHRRHASVCAVTKFLPSYAGLLLEKEVGVLSVAINNPEKPATVIVGGAKVETKLPMIKYLVNKFDNILVGGVVANEMLDSVLAEKHISNTPHPLRELPLSRREYFQEMDDQNLKIKLPIDFVRENNKRLDIGPETAKLYSKIIADSKTVIWNGPMGLFEKEDFSLGTKAISEAVAKAKGYIIIGGGDTIAAVHKFGDLEKISYVCTGGGAMLEFLAGKKMPGLKALK
ncbi:MAG: phosphoglycerate kinase [Patescibacteria group bacterium]|nr:phosphoglycerate kinase [Patescibacteria group bacterium]